MLPGRPGERGETLIGRAETRRRATSPPPAVGARFQIPYRPQNLHAWSLVASVGAWVESLQSDRRFVTAAASFHHQQGMALSTLAESLFDDPSEAVRHPVYRAHALAQRAMRRGSDDDLVAARELLAGVERLRSGDGVVADDYLQRLRGGATLDPNEVYRLSLRLKLDWISGEAPGRDDIESLDALADRHPWEQIVGYLAMGRGPLAARARDVLNGLDWPRLGVAVITEVFRAQLEFETAHKLSPGSGARRPGEGGRRSRRSPGGAAVQLLLMGEGSQHRGSPAAAPASS